MSAEPEAKVFRVTLEGDKTVWTIEKVYLGRIKAAVALQRFLLEEDREPGNYAAEDYLGRHSKASWDGEQIRAAA